MSSRLDRVALLLLVPATVVLPVGIVAATVFSANAYRSSQGLAGVVSIVFTFILLGSMTLHSWVLLRRPSTFVSRVLPHRVAVVHVILWALIVLMIIALALGLIPLVPIGIGAAIAIVSLVSFAHVVGSRELSDARALTSLDLSPMARVLCWAYLIAAAIALLAVLYFAIVGDSLSAAGGILGGPAIWSLVLLGLPWSYPLYLISILAGFAGFGEPAVAVAAASTVIANAVLVSMMLFSPIRRVRIVNWFFRLR